MNEIIGILHPGQMGIAVAAAAGEVYRRMGSFQDAPDVPPLESVISKLLKPVN